MTGDDIRDDITELEARIEALAEARERCRKISFAAKFAVAAGAAWIVLTLVTVLPFSPGPFFGALAVTIGSTVLIGSNKTTWEETEAALQATTQARDALIDRIAMRDLSEEPHTLH